MSIKVDACAAQHLGDRKEQQDRVAILPHSRYRGVALAVVADGMGGHTGGALAAEQVVYTARNNLDLFSFSGDTPRQLLESSMNEAHTMIKASRFINEKDPHSTAVMLLLQPGQVCWGYCGDSRLYHFRGNRLIERTVDHSYVEYLVSTGRISPEQALTHPSRNILLASLGGKEAPTITFGQTTELLPGDAFVLCSDGLWAYFDDDEFGSMVSENSARRACEALIDKARQRAQGAGDNISLAIIKLVDALPGKPVPPPLQPPRGSL